MVASVTLGKIAQHIDAELVVPAAQEGASDSDPKTLSISGLGSLGTATSGQLSHLSSPSYKAQLPTTQASAVIMSAQDVPQSPCIALVVDNPYLAFARATQLFVDEDPLSSGVHQTASIGADVQIDATAAIGPGVVIGPRTRIDSGAAIFANTVVGSDCVIGPDVTLAANVTLYRRVRIGARSIVHSGAVLGAPGFGYTPDTTGQMQEIAQLGGVQIGTDVSVGAGTTIDCGAIEDTIVEDGVKIDNQVQIGHNCRIGAHSLLCGCVGIAGSSVVGKHCVLAGGVGVGGSKPVEVCDGVMVTAYTPVTQSITAPGIYSGTIVFHEHGKWRRNALRFEALDDLFKRVKALEKQGH